MCLQETKQANKNNNNKKIKKSVFKDSLEPKLIAEH